MILLPVLLIYINSLLVVDHRADLTGAFIDAENNKKKLASIQYEHRIFFPMDDVVNLVTFKLRGHSNRNLDLGLGFGFRKQLWGGYAGVHLMQDYSYLYKTHNFQLGPLFEYANGGWTFYLNSYCPLTSIRYAHHKKIIPIIYTDGGVVFKNGYARIGLHPSFKHNYGGFGCVLRTEIPTPYGTFFFDTGKNSLYHNHARIGFNFHLFGPLDTFHEPSYREVGQMHKVKRPKKPPSTSFLPFHFYLPQNDSN